jgi:hypothetical protein
LCLRVNTINKNYRISYIDSLKMKNMLASRRWAISLCLFTALWFSLGGTLKVWLAQASGKTIEIVVCSGSGIKKISVSAHGSSDTSHEVTVKHCSNAPLALPTPEPNILAHLAYANPKTAITWHWAQDLNVMPNWLSSGKPPPGRAPPLSFLA